MTELVLVDQSEDASKPIGLCANELILLDDDWFDEADDEIAELFGVGR